MPRELATYLILFLALLLAQVLICNHILLFGVAMPIIFIYLIIRLPMSMSVSNVLTIAFFFGAIIDIFSDTAGINAFSCTVLAMCRKPIYGYYAGHEADVALLTPAISTLGLYKYIKYMATLVVIYFIISYSIIYFSFMHLSDIIGRIISSAALTALLLTGIDSLIIDRRDRKI